MTEIEIGRAVYERFSQESQDRHRDGVFISPERAIERLGELIAEIAPDVTRDQVPLIIAAFKAETCLRRQPFSRRMPS